MALRPDRPPDACPCRHGNLPAETAGQRPLLERAAAGDREAFALLYDDQVEAVYRYLLAWTGNPAEAASLTRQVFHTALAWLPSTAGEEIEAGAWLTAMARDAVAQRGGAAGEARGGVGAVGLAGRAGRPPAPWRRWHGWATRSGRWWCCACCWATRWPTPRTSPATASGP